MSDNEKNLVVVSGGVATVCTGDVAIVDWDELNDEGCPPETILGAFADAQHWPSTLADLIVLADGDDDVRYARAANADEALTAATRHRTLAEAQRSGEPGSVFVIAAEIGEAVELRDEHVTAAERVAFKY